MPGDLDRFPGLELAVDLLLQVGQLAAKLADLVADLGGLRSLSIELLDASLELEDGPFEGEPVFRFSHDRPSRGFRQQPSPEVHRGTLQLRPIGATSLAKHVPDGLTCANQRAR